MKQKIPRRFDFARDTFAFANELLWEYRLDTASGKMNFRRREPKPDYAHRCFVLTRVARQFLYHARFDAGQKIVGDNIYSNLIRKILSQNPRMPSESPVVVPGFPGLREFSLEKEKLLKSECGGAWRSYVLRSHWRMLFPISRAHQNQTANELLAEIKNNFSPIVHLVKFPSLTINHFVLMSQFHSINTLPGVIAPQLIQPVTVIIYKQFFDSVPKDFREAAMMDGASELQLLFRIYLPMNWGITTALAIITFIAAWNLFLWPFIAVNAEDKMNITVGITQVHDAFGVQYARDLAVAMVAALPVALVYLVFQRRVTQAIMLSAGIKG